ncbi:MAG: hypothetical protein IPI49_24455 [Myxococcales bacterium]|nr:hypothetical protein [Myxococcales bacterium]
MRASAVRAPSNRSDARTASDARAASTAAAWARAPGQAKRALAALTAASAAASAAALAAALPAALALGGCDAPSERSASWAYVHAAILRPACSTSSCHGNASSAAGIDLSTPSAAYSYLLGRPCDAPEHPQDAAGNYVFPFQPERSRLLYLLRGNRTTIMPPDSPLPDSEIAIIERWILDGASCQ